MSPEARARGSASRRSSSSRAGSSSWRCSRSSCRSSSAGRRRSRRRPRRRRPSLRRRPSQPRPAVRRSSRRSRPRRRRCVEKLTSLSMFARKDPFVQQQVVADTALASAAETAKPGVTTGGDKAGPATKAFTTRPAGAAATIVTVNGARQVLEPGMKFPRRTRSSCSSPRSPARSPSWSESQAVRMPAARRRRS